MSTFDILMKMKVDRLYEKATELCPKCLGNGYRTYLLHRRNGSITHETERPCYRCEGSGRVKKDK